MQEEEEGHPGLKTIQPLTPSCVSERNQPVTPKAFLDHQQFLSQVETHQRQKLGAIKDYF